MDGLILVNTGDWVLSASITYIKVMEPLPYILNVNNGHRPPGWMASFKTIKSAKNNFTRQFYKGIWKDSDEQN